MQWSASVSMPAGAQLGRLHIRPQAESGTCSPAWSCTRRSLDRPADVLEPRFISNSEHIKEASAAFAQLLADEEEERMRDAALNDHVGVLDTDASQHHGKGQRCSLARTAWHAGCQPLC